MKHNTLAIVLAVLLASGIVAATGGVVSSPIQDDASDVWGFEPDDKVERYGIDGNPSFVLTYADGEYSSLSSWADESTSREVQYHDKSQNLAVVSAPKDDIYEPGLVSDTGLATLAYVESIDYNHKVSLVEPVSSLENASRWENPVSSINTALTLGQGDLNKDGVAFKKDADESTVKTALPYVGADTVPQNGSGVTVAVLDTGATVGSGNSVYEGQVVAGKNFLSGETINTSAGDYSAIDDNSGHGSWTASAVHDVAPGADLAIGKVLGNDGSGPTESIVRGIKWACSEQDADIVSMSLGSPTRSDAIDSAIQDCVEQHDTIFVVASGNSRYVTGIGPSSPADSDNVIAVAASNATDPANASAAYFSEVGPDTGVHDSSMGETAGAMPDVAAPGMKMTVEVESGNSTLSGTSMATPIVAGAFALVEDDRNIGPSDAETLVDEYSARMPRAGVTEVGSGMVDAESMIDKTAPDRSQSDARNDRAVARDQYHRGLGGGSLNSWVAEKLHNIDSNR